MKRSEGTTESSAILCTGRRSHRLLDYQPISEEQTAEGERSAYPKAGPRNGAIRKQDVAKARTFGGNKSAFVPPPTANTGLPAVPARNRQARKEPKELLKPAPREKSIDIGAK